MGRRVDESSRRLDVRLTMGGEPTFVSVDDRDGAEWNTSALGPTKRGLAADLLWRLRRHYAADRFRALRPGQVVSRRAAAAVGARLLLAQDGEPAWRDASLFADERRNYGFGARGGGALPARARRRASACRTRTSQPGFEDVWYYLWRERRLPVNVDPFDARLDDELERERLRRVFTQGSMRRSATRCRCAAERRSGWRTGPWFLRDERMYLIPGDSAMGYRLPLDSLPVGERRRLSVPARARSDGDRPHASRVRSSARGNRSSEAPDRQYEATQAAPRTRTSRHAASSAPRSAPKRATACSTSSCRRCPTLEDYLELVAGVEATAAALGMPVLLEGYPPPSDPRLRALPDHAGSRRHRSQHAARGLAGTSSSSRRRRCTKKRASRG